MSTPDDASRLSPTVRPPAPTGRLSDPLIPARATPRSLAWRLSIGVSGAALLAGGVALGPIPVVPGFPLVVAGLLMLAASSELVRGLINRAETRLPTRVRRALRRVLHGKPSVGATDVPPTR